MVSWKKFDIMKKVLLREKYCIPKLWKYRIKYFSESKAADCDQKLETVGKHHNLLQSCSELYEIKKSLQTTLTLTISCI